MCMLEVSAESGQPVHIHYEDYDVGKPLVLIHGCPLSGRSDIRGDFAKVKLPALAIHSDSDALAPIDVRGWRTHQAISGSHVRLVKDASHGFNLLPATEFNAPSLASRAA